MGTLRKKRKVEKEKSNSEPMHIKVVNKGGSEPRSHEHHRMRPNHNMMESVALCELVCKIVCVVGRIVPSNGVLPCTEKEV